MRQNVERLLRAQPKAQGFLELPFAGLAPSIELCEPFLPPNTRIGPYLLREQIGEGGMGLVFVADQETPVRRRVALKVVKPGMDTRQVLARFEAERQALALMDHPNIAKVLDAGATDAGRPYFVMELVRGVPITEYCDSARLTTRQRLELFLPVCRAIQHAHQKGVIHRDIKPSNLLVTLYDSHPVPKVIDFGIAKAVGPAFAGHSVYTGFAQLVGTPTYMSPEQAEMTAQDVDTRADVYALGVVLYELLTGTTPFDGETLRAAGFDEMRRIIREDEPAKPSQRVTTLSAEKQSTVSGRRGVDGRHLGRQLRGGLDWVVMTCLAKDRTRRYESAGALAADIERYLRDEAVEACPPSKTYRVRTFARRNRRMLAVAGSFAVVLVTATVVSMWQAVKARDALQEAVGTRKQAMTDAAIAQAVNNFLEKDLLGQFNSVPQFPDEFGENSELTVKEAIYRATASVGKRFKDQPLVEAALRMVIGKSYMSQASYQLALPQFERAVALHKYHLGHDHQDTLVSISNLAGVYSRTARHQDAIALRKQLLEYRVTRLGPDHPDTLADACNLAGAYQFASRWDESVPLLEQVIEKQLTLHGPTHPTTLNTMHTLAWHYFEADRFVESIALHQKVMDTIIFNSGPNNTSLIWVRMTFAQACMRVGKFDQADELLREAIEQNQKLEDTIGQQIQHANILGWLSLNLLFTRELR
jgi:serine/threonine protein kinase/tetratricopeptide (TPR) repeat protein